jgi:hypothetical protein
MVNNGGCPLNSDCQSTAPFQRSCSCRSGFFLSYGLCRQGSGLISLFIRTDHVLIEQESTSSNEGVIIGVVVGVSAAVILLVIIITIVVRQRRRLRHRRAHRSHANSSERLYLCHAMLCSYIAANQPVERPMSDADSNKIVLADETHEVSDTADHGLFVFLLLINEQCPR